MATLFVLGVAEFEPLVEAARHLENVQVDGNASYARIRAAGELAIRRSDTGLGKAVWYGALTGGFLGRVAAFNDDELRIRDA